MAMLLNDGLVVHAKKLRLNRTPSAYFCMFEYAYLELSWGFFCCIHLFCLFVRATCFFVVHTLAIDTLQRKWFHKSGTTMLLCRCISWDFALGQTFSYWIIVAYHIFFAKFSYFLPILIKYKQNVHCPINILNIPNYSQQNYRFSYMVHWNRVRKDVSSETYVIKEKTIHYTIILLKKSMLIHSKWTFPSCFRTLLYLAVQYFVCIRYVMRIRAIKKHREDPLLLLLYYSNRLK